MVAEPEAWTNLHEVVDGEGVEKAEAKCRQEWYEGEEVPQFPIIFLLLPLVKYLRQVQFPLIIDIENNEHDDPKVPKKAKSSITAINEILNQTRGGISIPISGTP